MCPHVSLPDPPNTQTLDLVLKLGSLVPGSARKAVQASVYRGSLSKPLTFLSILQAVLSPTEVFSHLFVKSSVQNVA